MAWAFLGLLIGNNEQGLACLNKAIIINPVNELAWHLKLQYDGGNTIMQPINYIHIDNRQINGYSNMYQERVYYKGRIPYLAIHLAHPWYWLLVLGWNFGLLFTWIDQERFYLKITSHRILLMKGLYSRQQVDLELYRARDVVFYQSWLQRIFGCGIVTVNSGKTSPTLSFPMHRPYQLCDCIRKAIHVQRKEMRSIHRD